MIRLTSVLALFTLFAGCSNLSGYRSKVAPEVLVVAQESARRPPGITSTITVIRPRAKSLMELVHALLIRVQARGGRYVMGMEAWWIERGDEGTYRCGARIRPQPVSLVGDSAPLLDVKGSTDPQAYGLRSWEDGFTLPSDEPLVRPRPFEKLGARLPMVSHRQWGLGVTEPACVRTEDPAHDRVTLEGSFR